MKRTYIKDIKKNKRVLLKGWAQDIRDFGNLKFILLKDKTGLVQLTIKKPTPELKKIISEISKESAIEAEGKVVENKKAPNGLEILLDFIKILNKADSPLPIDVTDKSKTNIDKRLDFRFLDLHNHKIQSIFNIQSEITHFFRKFFYDKNYTEIQTPSIISSSSEGGTELFSVVYFEKHAFLAQSPQLYKQMMATSLLEKVFTITPVWRAEKHNTTRHLNESRQMDIEVAFADEFEVMKELEECVKFMVKNIKEKCKEDLKNLGIILKIPKSKYLSYEETIKLLNKNKIKLESDEDLTPEAEKKLSEIFPETIVFVYDWPLSLKPFYIFPKSLDKDEKISKGFDAIYQGVEISSGGQRVHLPEVLIKQLHVKGLNHEHFEGYINSFRYGAPKHAGWSIGLERFTMVLLGLENIRECVLFPRDRDRLAP